MKKILMGSLILCLFFLAACEVMPNQIVLETTCEEVSEEALFLGMIGPKPEDVINYMCMQACLNETMRYTGSYECEYLTGKIVCYCAQMPR
jgi:hypothetical protein